MVMFAKNRMRRQMNKRILWGKEIKESFTILSYKNLIDFLDLLDFITDNRIENIICEKTLDDEELWTWLYSKDQIKLNRSEERRVGKEC